MRASALGSLKGEVKYNYKLLITNYEMKRSEKGEV